MPEKHNNNALFGKREASTYLQMISTNINKSRSTASRIEAVVALLLLFFFSHRILRKFY